MHKAYESPQKGTEEVSRDFQEDACFSVRPCLKRGVGSEVCLLVWRTDDGLC